MDFPYLSIIVFLPIIGAILIALLPHADPRRIKLTAAFFTLVTFALSLSLFFMFDQSLEGAQFVERASWIPPPRRSILPRHRWAEPADAYSGHIPGLHRCPRLMED